MPKAKLHIVSFDVPAPPDYGGAIDVYYKIKSLAEAGCEIYLHCFQYGRPESEELKELCKEVWYYPRKTGIKGISLALPYIVYSRRDKSLLKRLHEIDAPILFEGLHTTYYANHPLLKQRLKALRTHNVEFDYYSALYQKEKSTTRKFYFMAESALLYRYEQHLNDVNLFAALSQADNSYFTRLYPKTKHLWLPAFHPYQKVSGLTGSGTYCLYHGNLSHPENIEAALFLINEVFAKINTPLVIAGRQPDKAITDACGKLTHCTLFPNPSADEMEALIENAHIHVLPTFQPTGMKLKLLYALFKGRHVIVNKHMLYGTGLDDICHIAENASTFVNEISSLIEQPFTQQDKYKRELILLQHYDNSANAQKLITYLQQKSL